MKRIREFLGGQESATARAIRGSRAVGSNDCLMVFTLPTVPDAPFYSIEVGHRGALTYSRDDLNAKTWHVDLTLGS